MAIIRKKWLATTGSLIRKGDVVEFGLAMVRMHTKPTVAEDIRHSWKTFVDLIEVFYNGLQDCIKYICTCEDGRFPTSKCLPEPWDFARLIAFTWSGMHGHDDVTRLLGLQKAGYEIAKLTVRIGSCSWKNCPIHSVDAMSLCKFGMLDVESK